MFDLGWAIASIGSTYTVERRTSTVNATGDYVEGTPVTFSVAGSLQPVAGDMVERMPEGMRTKAAAVLFTETDLQGSLNGYAGDRLTYSADKTFEVLGEIDWMDPVGGFSVYALERVLP